MDWLYYLIAFLVLIFSGLYLVARRNKGFYESLEEFADNFLWNSNRNFTSKVRNRREKIRNELSKTSGYQDIDK